MEKIEKELINLVTVQTGLLVNNYITLIKEIKEDLVEVDKEYLKDTFDTLNQVRIHYLRFLEEKFGSPEKVKTEKDKILLEGYKIYATLCKEFGDLCNSYIDKEQKDSEDSAKDLAKFVPWVPGEYSD